MAPFANPPVSPAVGGIWPCQPPNPVPKWVLSSIRVGPRSDRVAGSKLVSAVHSEWPKVLAHARKERLHQESWLTTPTWPPEFGRAFYTPVQHTRTDEWKTWGNHGSGSLSPRTFYQGFSRTIRKEQRRKEEFILVSSVQELEVLGESSGGMRA